MKKEEGIYLSKEHGVNPSITRCECCGKEYGIALFGKLKGDKKAPRDVFTGLCDNCQKVVDANGILLIEIKDGDFSENPYRTGRIVGITKEAKERLFKDIESPMAYIEETMFNNLFKDVI